MSDHEKPVGLSGIVPVRNGNSLDYCWQLAVESMLPVCDEVIISDGQSDDGTFEEAEALAGSNPKIRVVRWPWPNPVGDPYFLQKWINWTQQHVRFSSQCQLDADEMFLAESYPRMRKAVEQGESLYFYRANLWRDPRHEAPYGTVCAHLVVRQGPNYLEAVCDNIHPIEPDIKQRAKHDPSLNIVHLGFLRSQKQFLKKARAELSFLLNTWDPRLEQAEQTGEDWVKICGDWRHQDGTINPLLESKIALPESAKAWLRVRGHQVL